MNNYNFINGKWDEDALIISRESKKNKNAIDWITEADLRN
jgi:hypothetical protein